MIEFEGILNKSKKWPEANKMGTSTSSHHNFEQSVTAVNNIGTYSNFSVLIRVSASKYFCGIFLVDSLNILTEWFLQNECVLISEDLYLDINIFLQQEQREAYLLYHGNRYLTIFEAVIP